MYLVSTFEMAAMQAMGKLPNPMTGKIQRELEQAQFSIDVLDMIKERSKGNLTEFEARYLENALGQLKLNFVDEKMKPEPEKEKKPDTGSEENMTEESTT